MTVLHGCDFYNQFEFASGIPLSPLQFGTWPDKRKDNLYWVAKKDFILDRIPRKIIIKIAADRHYEIFINSKNIAGQRNYFNGDHCLFGQNWDYKGAAKELLKAGVNKIEIFIRTDIWGSKNYVPFHPFVMLEIVDENECVILSTDKSWQVACINGWRSAMFPASLIVHEEIKQPPLENSGIMGSTGKIKFSIPYIWDRGNDFPALYEWTEKAERVACKIPKVIVQGGCMTESKASVFKISEIFSLSDVAILRTVIKTSCRKETALSISAMCKCEVRLNGRKIAERDSLPSRNLMRQYNYASPVCRLQLECGENILEFQFGREHMRFFEWEEKYGPDSAVAGMLFKIILHGIDNLSWICGSENIMPVESAELPWDQFNAKGTEKSKGRFSVELNSSKFSLFNLERGKKFHVLFDYGQTVRAYLSFRINSDTAGRIYLAYGIMNENDAVDCARNNRKAVDIINVPAGESLYRAVDNRAFVYLDMIFDGFDGDVLISDFNAYEEHFIDAGSTSFESPDSLMNKIWRAAQKTSELCCDEVYMDNPDRERGQWLDNVHANSAAGYYVFGETKKPAKVLEEILLLQRRDGQLPGHTGAWGERIPLQGHMALYIQSIWRYFWYTGDLEFVERTFGGVLKILEFWSGFRNQHGLLENLEALFIDWGVHIYSYCPESANPPPVGVNTAINAYYLRCLQIASELAAYLGDNTRRKELIKSADTVKNAILKFLFDNDKGLFRDGMNNPLAEKNYSQAANALAVISGAVPDGSEKTVLRKAFTESVPWQDIIPASAHFTTQTGEALFACGMGKTAYEWIRRGFGPMTNDPAGTLWETWEPYVSHCQGTASGLLYLLARYHAGLFPAEPGFAKVGINPCHCGQKHLKAALKTPQGIVKVEWEYENGVYEYNLVLPPPLENCEIVANESIKLT